MRVFAPLYRRRSQRPRAQLEWLAEIYSNRQAGNRLQDRVPFLLFRENELSTIFQIAAEETLQSNWKETLKRFNCYLFGPETHALLPSV